jgi:uncharacterized protein YndB with AHSA1/START domain
MSDEPADQTIDNEALAEFEDRQTLRYVRFYPVDAFRVWKAVTTSECLDVWLYPVSRVEPRLGGRCSFSWGSPEDPNATGTVTRFEPPRQVRYELESSNFIQFDLEPVEGGTRFTFTQFFAPGFRHADDGMLQGKDGVQPAGPGTPWRAGFLAGFHLNFAFLGRLLAEDWSEDRIAHESRRLVEDANARHLEGRPPLPSAEWQRLVELYYDHVLATWPKQ